VFLGTHTPKLDDKGRLFLPARFREELAEGVVITKGQERCLYVFKRADFEVEVASLKSASITAKDARDFGRLLFAGAVDDAPDSQGRVRVPAPLRAYAGLSKHCVVIGAGTRLEIWDATAWATYEAEQDPLFAAKAEEVVPGFM
jgi:MraZ protein